MAASSLFVLISKELRSRIHLEPLIYSQVFQPRQIAALTSDPGRIWHANSPAKSPRTPDLA